MEDFEYNFLNLQWEDNNFKLKLRLNSDFTVVSLDRKYVWLERLWNLKLRVILILSCEINISKPISTIYLFLKRSSYMF